MNRNLLKYLVIVAVCAILGLVLTKAVASEHPFNPITQRFAQDTVRSDTTKKAKAGKLPYPFKDQENITAPERNASPLYLKDPSNVKPVVEYLPGFNEYLIEKKMGKLDYRLPSSMSAKEYQDYQFKQSLRNYWHEKAAGNTASQSFLPKINLGGEALDNIFGSNVINIVPQGNAELIFGIKTNKTDNPFIQENLRRTTTFDFQQKIQMNVNGSIGDKVKLGFNYNTEATFDFENKTKLEYSGKEDEILKKVEAGNVTLPLSGTLITGSQSLFGLKTEMQFGKLTVTTVLSQQKGQTTQIQTKGGAQTNTFSISADQYEANRHFFLSGYFRNHYNEALKNPNAINSKTHITRIEVWVTNKTAIYTNSRHIAAFVDLGEPDVYNKVPEFAKVPEAGEYPRNGANNMYQNITDSTRYQIRKIEQVYSSLEPLSSYNFISGQDYEKIENARKLSSSEYEVNTNLGYISLNSALNTDEVLAVAYEYEVDGKTYKVGELSTDVAAPNVLVLKLIKGTNLTPLFKPTWNLMMKNIYSLGAYQVNSKNFQLNVLYQDDQTGQSVNYISAGKIKGHILLKVLGLDKLNSQGDPYPDGAFDFVDGVTIKASSGRVIFPVLEPFGSAIGDSITGGSPGSWRNDPIAKRYVFQELYDSTLTKAKLLTEKDKFKLTGSYQASSSSEINLNAMNIPQGSVTVTAGGVKLTEGIDYTVDYTLGRVKIINQGLISSGTSINVSLENNALFSIQTKTLLGTHLDYKVSDNFKLGATLLYLNEKPLTQKVNIGEEPISNTMWGLTGSYNTQSQFLTTLIDKLPLIQTKETSAINLEAEFAQLIPGHNKAIGQSGTSYIDDFESSETSIDLKSLSSWFLASTPQKQNFMFPEGSLNNDLKYGMNRARIAWYNIDPLFLNNSSSTPANIKNNPDFQSDPFVAQVYENQLFPNKEYANNIPPLLSILNLAFYPTEKGPYNFDVKGENGISAGIDQNGNLLKPQTRWGGIMRSIPTVDFESANIQFIEFWMMNPFIEDSVNNSGQLYFNLGDISEDILRDSRKSFENGLPTSGDSSQYVDNSSVWGRVPKFQSVVNAFNNDESTRKYQDVGLDGISDGDEDTKFSGYIDAIRKAFPNSKALQDALKDPSNDDFHYFKGSDYDQENLGILERYKKYNNTEGNSSGTQDISTTIPDGEDINNDNTMNESENYFQYKVDLDPNSLKIGENYVVDYRDAVMEFPNHTKKNVRWYQFRIPIEEGQPMGNIQNFESIRFMRMFLRGFQKPIVLRFATLNLVRGEWYKYTLPLNSVTSGLTSPQTEDGTFDISAVNIEENADKTPVNYVLPPGIDRVIDPTSQQVTQLNEQAMVLKVHNLQDGDARGAYKTCSLNLLQYKKLKMFIHAEALNNEMLKDNDLTVFIQLGTDNSNNYYEYEVPVKVTPYGRYNNNSESARRIVWPLENEMDISLDIFTKAKLARNNAKVATTSPYLYSDGKNTVRICGNPTLSNVRTILIGIRNPKETNGNGVTHSGEIWVNELRLTDFKENGGWAANARATTKLADLGTVTLSGLISQPGFGSIDQNESSRSQEQHIQYNISSNLELGKFFPQKAKVSIPVYIGYSQSVINPKYNPLDPDIPLNVALDNAKNRHERDSIKHISQDYTTQKSINFTNVKVDKTSAKPKFYDPGNFSATYSYTQTYARNINTEYDIVKEYLGILSYNFNTQPKNFSPFSKVKFLNAPIFRLIKDFNFNYTPSRVSVRTDITRDYEITKLRNIDNPLLKIDSTVNKSFLWNRYYTLKFDLTRSLTLDFSATNLARIDEPLGAVDSHDRLRYQEWKDSVWRNIKQFGRTTQYHHDIAVGYTLPINKIPLFNWVSVTARYGGSYEWDVGKVVVDHNLGNTIQNNNQSQLNAQLSLLSLYNKVGFLKKINQYNPKAVKKRTKKVNYEKDGIFLTAKMPRRIIHNLATENVKVKMYTSDGKEIKGKVDIVNGNKISFVSDSSYRNVKVKIEGEVELTESPFAMMARSLAKALMGVKNVSASYTQQEGTYLPGYLPNSKLFGSQQTSVGLAPGLPFILGVQDKDFAYNAGNEYRWLTTDTLLNVPYTMTHTDNLNVRTTFEPFDGFRIDLNAFRSYTENKSEYFSYDEDGFYKNSKGEYIFSGKQVNGNFSMSYITLGTAFEKQKQKDQYYSNIFHKFKEYRMIIAKRLEFQNQGTVTTDSIFPKGYGSTSQQVLIPAFLAAYSNKNPERISLSSMPSVLSMMPNWSFTYDGLSKLGIVQNLVRNVSLRHAYRSTYNVGSFTSNSDFGIDAAGKSTIDAQGNYIPKYDIASVSITEMFSPLLSVDMTWKNNLMTNVEFKRTRNLNMSFANNQLTETRSNEYVVGAGYRFNQVQLIFKSASGQKAIKSDLVLNADFSLRQDIAIIRKMEENLDEATSGQQSLGLKFSANYALSNNLTLQFYYEYNQNKPYVSETYPTSNSNIGFSIKFSLTQ